MIKTLHVEWLKIRSYRTFWILLAITVISIPAFSYMLYNLMNNSFPKVKGKSVLGSPFAFPDAWQTVAWNSSLLFIVPAILIITLTTNEFTYRTHRQNVIDGWSRGQFIGIKLIEVLLLSVLCTIAVALTAIGFGLIGNKLAAGVSIWQDFRFVFFYFVEMISYSMIAFLLSVLIRRAGLAIGAFLIYMLLEQVAVGIGRAIYKIPAVDYFPEEVTDRLIPVPYAKAIFAGQATTWEHHIPVYLLVALLYLVVYCLITGQRFLKSDL
jgi:ABC-2 type transport system permease protein